jgi:hypothetical protein
MATQDIENKPMEATEEQQAPIKSSREAFVARIKDRHPDLDVNDEEGFYSAVNADYDEDDEGREDLKRYREDDERMREIFESDPRMANIFLGMARGENVFEYILDKFGPDFLEYINDPENEEVRERIAQKQSEWLEKQAKAKEIQEQTEANIDKALDAFDAVADELGADEGVKEEAFKRFVEFQQRAIVNDIDADMWRMFFNGVTHDADVEQASLEGETRGRNEKIRERLRGQGSKNPMDMGGTSAPTQSAPRSRSIFDLANEAK